MLMVHPSSSRHFIPTCAAQSADFHALFRGRWLAQLQGLEQYIPLDPNRQRPFRHLIHTSMPESSISPFLVKLTDRMKAEDIKVGSYPKVSTLSLPLRTLNQRLGMRLVLGRAYEHRLTALLCLPPFLH